MQRGQGQLALGVRLARLTSAPLELVQERKKPGDKDTLRESLQKFKNESEKYKDALKEVS